MRDVLEFAAAIAGVLVCIALAIFLVVGVPVIIWGDRNVQDLNLNAPGYLRSLGFDVRGREGFTYGLLSQPGGCVWYTMTRPDQPTTVYSGCVSKWHNGTYELWGPRAINAVSAH